MFLYRLSELVYLVCHSCTSTVNVLLKNSELDKWVYFLTSFRSFKVICSSGIIYVIDGQLKLDEWDIGQVFTTMTETEVVYKFTFIFKL